MTVVPGKAERLVAIRVLEVLIWLAMIQFGALGVVWPLIGLAAPGGQQGDSAWGVVGAPSQLEVELNKEGIEAVLGPDVSLPEGQGVRVGDVTLTPVVKAWVEFDQPGLAGFMATTGSDVILGLTSLVTCVFLWLVVASVRRGEPFDRRNVTRLYVAGVVCIGGSALYMLANAGGRMAATWGGTLEDLSRAEIALSFGPLAVGTLFAVMAEVFRRGMILRAETDGLV
ncbi:MAG: DUF2975 domain-containing protein [Bifidobacteriaceae bacterium]|nr:DUF2975 domain-containing protein [Bifidobacteriaceae bacterium]